MRNVISADVREDAVPDVLRIGKAILDQGWLEPISHAHTHPSLPKLTTEEIRREMQTSIEVLAWPGFATAAARTAARRTATGRASGMATRRV